MTDKTRYTLLAFTNCLLFIGFLAIHYVLTGGTDDRRLFDLNFASDFKLIMIFLSMIIGGVVCNLSLMWRTHSRDDEREEVKKILAEIMKRQSEDKKAHASSV